MPTSDALASDPQSITRYYSACQFAEILGPAFNQLNEDGLKLAWASVIAYELKPYRGSSATSLDELLAEDGLDCDNYAILTWRLFQLLAPNSPVKLKVIGWDGGAVGNHAQIFSEGTGAPLLLDPTIGLVAIGSFDQVVKGDPVTVLMEFYHREELADFRSLVMMALAVGLYKQSDLLYVFDDLNTFLRGVKVVHQITP